MKNSEPHSALARKSFIHSWILLLDCTCVAYSKFILSSLTSSSPSCLFTIQYHQYIARVSVEINNQMKVQMNRKDEHSFQKMMKKFMCFFFKREKERQREQEERQTRGARWLIQLRATSSLASPLSFSFFISSSVFLFFIFFFLFPWLCVNVGVALALV